MGSSWRKAGLKGGKKKERGEVVGREEGFGDNMTHHGFFEGEAQCTGKELGERGGLREEEGGGKGGITAGRSEKKKQHPQPGGSSIEIDFSGGRSLNLGKRKRIRHKKGRGRTCWEREGTTKGGSRRATQLRPLGSVQMAGK